MQFLAETTIDKHMIKIGSKYKFNPEKWAVDHPWDEKVNYEVVAAAEIDEKLFCGESRDCAGEPYLGEYYIEYFDLVEE